MNLTNKGVGSLGFGANIVNKIDRLAEYKHYGKVVNVVGMLIHVGGSHTAYRWVITVLFMRAGGAPYVARLLVFLRVRLW